LFHPFVRRPAMNESLHELREEFAEAERLSAALPGPARTPRTGRLVAEIVGNDGLAYRYRVVPLPHLPDCLRAYRLVLLAAVACVGKPPAELKKTRKRKAA